MQDKYQSILPLKGPDGDQLFTRRIYGVSHGMVVSTNTKYPEAIIRWVDYLNSPDITIEPTMGLEEEGCWTRLEGTKYSFNSDKTPEGISWTEWTSNTGWMNSSPTFQSTKFVEENRVLDNDKITGDALIRTQDYWPYTVDEVFPPLMIEPKINEEINMIKTELMTLVKNYFAKAIMQGVTDAEWKEFQENLKKAKYQQFEELYQKVYDGIKK